MRPRALARHPETANVEQRVAVGKVTKSPTAHSLRWWRRLVELLYGSIDVT
jgi:hypothetical protein